MRVSRGKASVSGDITVSEDLDFLTTYQVKRLASPATGEALRKGNKDIGNAEIKNAANIAISKLVDDYLPEVVLTAQGDILTRNGSVPKKLAKGTDGQFLKIGANEPEWATLTSPLTVAETEVFSGNTPGTAAWTDLNLSGTVGANKALVLLKFWIDVVEQAIAFRKNGDADEFYADTVGDGCAFGKMNNASIFGVYCVVTDDAGKIEWKCHDTNEAVTIDIIAFVK